jgi:parvulin-like peptidyl-prolyl isomerase
MFGTIRRHQSWLWALIIGATILSLVVWTGANNKTGNGSSAGANNYGLLAGRPISRDQIINAAHEVELDYFLKNQQWPTANTDVNRQAYMRLFLIQKQKELGIVIPTDAAAAFAHRILGQGSLDDFVDKILKPEGMDATDFDRFLRHELGIEQLAMTAGVSGKLVTPQEAETMYRLEHQDVDARLVYFSATNYIATVPAPAEAVAQFYTNQLANYRVPDQVQVSYVKYNVTNYLPAALAAITNLDQMVQANVERLGTNLYHNAKTPDESKANIRSDIIREHALIDSRKVALAFATDLDQMTNHSLENFEAQAAAKGLKVGTTAPFDREYGPQDLTVPPAFAQKAFALAEDDRYAGPIVAEDGVYVIALKQRIPSETPSLASIKDKVTADFRYMSAVQMAQQDAFKFDSTLTNGLATGKTFGAICAEAGVKPQSLPPFSLDTRSLPAVPEDKINFGALKQAAFGTPPGKVSQLAAARDGAYLVYVEKRLPIDEAKMKTELPAFLSYLRSARENDAFNQWFNTEIHQDPDFLQYVQKMVEESQMKSGTRRTKS